MTQPRGIVPHVLLTQPVPLPWVAPGSERTEQRRQTGTEQVLPLGLWSNVSWVLLLKAKWVTKNFHLHGLFFL